MGKVFLLTGAPATGKSTLRKNLVEQVANLMAFDYGELLLQKKRAEGVDLTYEAMRSQSSRSITSRHVAEMDEQVIRRISQLRTSSHIIIDSHAVTREEFGFRAVPFSSEQLRRIAFDAVVSLRCDSEAILSRIANDSGGRLSVTRELAQEHQILQESVGLTYAITCGCPFFVLDSTQLDKSALASKAREIMVAIIGSGSN
jgi:adenylate kinase